MKTYLGPWSDHFAGSDMTFCVRENMRGMPDQGILTRAQAEGRTLVTLDKDFGELAFRSGLPSACCVILLRLSGASADEDNSRAIAAIRVVMIGAVVLPSCSMTESGFARCHDWADPYEAWIIVR